MVNSNITKKISPFLVAALLAGSTALYNVNSAYAGFEWRPPQDIVQPEGVDGDNVVINPRSTRGADAMNPMQVERAPLPNPNADSLMRNNPVPQDLFSQQQQPQRSSVITEKRAPQPEQPVFDRRFQEATQQPAAQNTVSNQRMPLDLKQKQVPLNMVGEQNETATRSANRHDDSLYQIAEGFGRQIPLSIALRQIAPVDYEFLFEKGVDTGALVNWEGGQAWQVVMGSTLSKKGLSFSVRDNIVTVFEMGSAPMQADNFEPQTAPGSEETVSVERLRSDIESQIAGASAMANMTPLPGNLKQDDMAMTPIPGEDGKSAVREVEILENNVVPPMAETSMDRQRKVQREQAEDKAEEVAYGQEPLELVAFQKPVQKQVRTWYGAKGSSLRSVLNDWSNKANVELYWDSEFDYPLKATVVVTGSFENAVQQILEGFDKAQPRPLGRLHKNNSDGPPVLIVEANDLIR